MKAVAVIVRYLAIPMFGLAMGVGCADSPNDTPTTRPMSVKDRQNQALQDPFSYGGIGEKHDISGGGINNLDKKALKRDVDTFFNP